MVMTIRVKLLILFFLTLTLLGVIGLLAASVYREVLDTERSITAATYKAVETSRQAESLFRAQLNAWNNVLLRGGEPNLYHHYLKEFYQTERLTRKQIKHLSDQTRELPDIHNLAEKLTTAHKMMGRRLRDAIRVFNATEENAIQVTDQFVAGVEEIPTQLLDEVIHLLQDNQHARIGTLTTERKLQENILLALLLAVLVVSFAVFLWLLDKNIVQPAQRANYLADVIDNAQRVAKFGTWDWESNSDQHYWSDSLYDMLELDKEETASLKHFIAALHHDDRLRVHQTIDHALEEKRPFELEARIQLSDGDERVVQQRGLVKKIAENGSLRMTSIVYDITERKESERRLSYLANYDTLTGMPNRNLFRDRLEHAVAQADRNNSEVALLYLDLDHFKAVNDALGHHVGDELLVEAGDRIRRVIREGDTAARLGGDEFTIIVEGIDDNVPVATIAEHVLCSLNQNYRIQEHEVFVSASMGITFYPTDGRDVDTLLKNADSAMYLAKEEGRNCYHFYTQELNQRAHERLHLENSLRLALEKDEYRLHFQPQIELGSGRIIGAEALLRWAPDQSPVSPARFIPVLEETGLILPVGKWVLEQACITARAWQQNGFDDFRIAVNLAARQLRQADIVQEIKKILDMTGLAPEYLEIELTESTLIDTSISRRNLQSLKQLGVRLAIDDFGTGYSSLSYLKQYSVDVLKIDRTFIQDICKDSDDDAVTSAIVALSHQLDMKVIAEGVETLEQLEFLKKVNCDQAQGFLIGRPMVRHQFEQWMLKYQRRIPESGCGYCAGDVLGTT
jgi:diguanylate cyclase (GGDEF)-like protein/PAS domain S-box-containing protein